MRQGLTTRLAWRRGALVLAVLMVPGVSAQPLNAVANQSRPNASLEGYRKHLEELEALVATCRAQRTRDACNPDRVGPDDQVEWMPGGVVAQRTIRYEWLREILSRAEETGEPSKANPLPQPGGRTKPLSVDTLLDQAQQRLQDDWKQAGGPAPVKADYSVERQSITTILARREYQGVHRVSAWERLKEWLQTLIANLLGHLIRYGSRSPWIAFVLRALLLGSLCVGLVWALVQIERRSRVRLVPEAQPSPQAPSAREWQLWFEDAQKMAAQGLWREAIHFLYWASISRLEAKRIWPADRARTPREYLQLFPAADPRKPGLTALTRSFERTWYGGREAGSSDFQVALRRAAELGVE